MSFRTAARFTARVAAQRSATVQTVARRAASSSAGHKTGSDTPWMIGSLVGFGSLTALMLFPSNKAVAEHAVPHNKEKEEIDESAPKAAVGKEPVESSSTIDRTVASDDPKDTHNLAGHSPDELPSKKEGKGEKPSEELKPEAKDGGSNANETASAQTTAEDGEKEEPEDEKKNETEEGSEESRGEEPSEEPSEKDAAASVVQAEKSDAPEVAKAAEHAQSEKE